MSDKSPEAEARLVVRHLTLDDLEAIQRLQKECFPDLVPWSRANLENHLELFPEGQIGIELDGTLVASSSSLILDSSDWTPTATCSTGWTSWSRRAHAACGSRDESTKREWTWWKSSSSGRS